MASSRDDFVIAIRSAFLKKSYQQKFSLLTLIFLSLTILFLGSFNFKVIQYIKIGIKEVVYRSSFVVSIPENYVKKLNFQLKDHLNLYENYKKNEDLLNDLRKKKLTNEFLVLENEKLRNLINESIKSKDIYAKVLVDKDSPYLKSIVLNKGSKNNVKLGMAIVDDSYLIGKIIEVNYTNSRALLLSDLNSKIPVTLLPDRIQAVVSGTGKNHGIIEYTKEKVDDEINEKDRIIYTSGFAGLFRSGIPVGRMFKKSNGQINFFSKFTQLEYVKIVAFDMESQK